LAAVSRAYLNVMINKHTLRQTLKQRRRALSTADIENASRRACALLSNHPRFQLGNHIALYSPFGGEISPLSLQHGDKYFYFPVVDAHFSMRFVAVKNTDDMTENRHGILEPKGDNAISIKNLDVVVIPLVGFNRQGDRLGMGAGYYDRALAHCREDTFKVGLAYSWQEVEQLCSEPWDIPLHAVVTEQEFIDC
jgi:5-formyltetrahydrofolate cyclo-ligase